MHCHKLWHATRKAWPVVPSLSETRLTVTVEPRQRQADEPTQEWPLPRMSLCDECAMQGRCAGFFSTERMRQRRAIRAIVQGEQ